MMRERVQELRYEIGDAMGDYAPDYFRRSRNLTTEFLIGAGSVLAAIGIGYLATRLANQRTGRLIDRIAFNKGLSSGRARPTAHGTSGGEMPNVGERSRHASRSERAPVHHSDGGEWPKPESSTRP